MAPLARRPTAGAISCPAAASVTAQPYKHDNFTREVPDGLLDGVGVLSLGDLATATEEQKKNEPEADPEERVTAIPRIVTGGEVAGASSRARLSIVETSTGSSWRLRGAFAQESEAGLYIGRGGVEDNAEHVERIWRRAREWGDWSFVADPDAAEIVRPALRLARSAYRAVRRSHGDEDVVERVRAILDRARDEIDELRRER